MKVRRDFLFGVREVENFWIVLSDGARLAGRMWLPEGAGVDFRVPALLEYLPYRKSDGTAVRDAQRHPYFAGHGYASIRVDMRGSGDSDGILFDEYLKQEQDDALEVLAWIGAQPWCTGDVGIFGKSWGGFNALQIAARRPPQLKAVIAMHFTDDRYTDDVHYMGGCLLTSQMLPWASVMLGYNAAPPDPRFVGERWREMWLARMAETPPFVEEWLRHQRRDGYWQHGSVGEDYGAIEVPVYAVGGWADSYNNSVPRLLAGLRGPRKGLIGPWGHHFPEVGRPGPAIGFLQESLRWWDYWLKGEETGIMAEPMLRVWMQEAVGPAVVHEERAGRWVTEAGWPPAEGEERVYFLNSDGAAGRLGDAPGPEYALDFVGLQQHGFETGDWGAHGLAGELAGDQRGSDGECLSFTSAPLEAPVELLGRPAVGLALAADRPLALVAVRLCDVAPTGASTLVTWGLLNLTQREGHERPSPLTPGERFEATVELNVMAYRLPAGHRWRVSVSPTHARHAWPSPEAATLTLFAGEGCTLRLPLRMGREGEVEPAPFAEAEAAPPLAVETLREAGREKVVTRDVARGVTTLRLRTDEGRVRFVDNGLAQEAWLEECFSIADGEPLSARQEVRSFLAYERGDWEVRIETTSTLRSDEAHFWLMNRVEGFEGAEKVFDKTWEARIARDGM